MAKPSLIGISNLRSHLLLSVIPDLIGDPESFFGFRNSLLLGEGRVTHLHCFAVGVMVYKEIANCCPFIEDHGRAPN